MTQHIVVIGAGYSGLAAALRAARRLPDARITLINPRAYFVERVRLHQLAAGQRLRRYPLTDILGTAGIELVVGSVRTIDTERREVTVDSLDTPVPYDTLVYALGSVADTSTPGVAEHAATVAGPAEAQALRDKVATMARQEGTLTVVGAD